MAIITKITSTYILQLSAIPEISDYLANLEDVSRRIKIQEKPMVKKNLGRGIFALEQNFETLELEDCFYESHKKYIDIQIMLAGSEIMKLFDASSNQANLLTYDEQTDFCIYKVNPNIVSSLYMTPGDVYVFFPTDGHLGMLKNEHKELVEKTVIKVPYEDFAESLGFRWK